MQNIWGNIKKILLHKTLFSYTYFMLMWTDVFSSRNFLSNFIMSRWENMDIFKMFVVQRTYADQLDYEIDSFLKRNFQTDPRRCLKALCI